MRSTGGLLLSRIGQLRHPICPAARHLPALSYVRSYASHNTPIFSDEPPSFWDIAKTLLGFNKNKQVYRLRVPEAKASKIDEYEWTYKRLIASGDHSRLPPIEIPHRPTFTDDGLSISVSGRLSVKVVDPKLAVEVPVWHLVALAQTKMRHELSNWSLSEIYKNRIELNSRILMEINDVAKNMGFECDSYEIMDVRMREAFREWYWAHLHKKHVARLEARGHVFKA